MAVLCYGTESLDAAIALFLCPCTAEVCYVEDLTEINRSLER